MKNNNPMWVSAPYEVGVWCDGDKMEKEIKEWLDRLKEEMPTAEFVVKRGECNFLITQSNFKNK